MERFSSCAAEKKRIRSGGSEISSEWPLRRQSGLFLAASTQSRCRHTALFSRIPGVARNSEPSGAQDRRIWRVWGSELEDSGGGGSRTPTGLGAGRTSQHRPQDCGKRAGRCGRMAGVSRGLGSGGTTERSSAKEISDLLPASVANRASHVRGVMGWGVQNTNLKGFRRRLIACLP